MKKRLEELKNREGGFTLIELMVVVLIIGILVAIAVPKFLTAQNGAKSKAAQSNARSAESVAESVYADMGSWQNVRTDLIANPTNSAFKKADAALFATAEGSSVVSTGPSVVAWSISPAVAGTVPSTTDGVTIAVLSSGGDCYMIQNTGAGTNYAKIPAVAAGGCKTSAFALTLTNAGTDAEKAWS